MKNTYRRRRLLTAGIVLIITIVALIAHPSSWQQQIPSLTSSSSPATGPAAEALHRLPVKGRAPKTDYARTQFGSGWQTVGLCDTRNIILQRDLTQVAVDDECHVVRGMLIDPYGGKTISFVRGEQTSQAVQIDHVVALSNAWQTGAQQLSTLEREAMANDPLELLAVDGELNQQKSDGDAATWLPPNKNFRCTYVARQIAVKTKYRLWITPAEKDAMTRVLSGCPDQQLPQ
jgi:hypothetical protein